MQIFLDEKEKEKSGRSFTKSDYVLKGDDTLPSTEEENFLYLYRLYKHFSRVFRNDSECVRLYEPEAKVDFDRHSRWLWTLQATFFFFQLKWTVRRD